MDTSINIPLVRLFFAFIGVFMATTATAQEGRPLPRSNASLLFESIPDLPDKFGVAGPFAGVHQDRLLVAGGANFGNRADPKLWELPKRYHDRIWILTRRGVNASETKYTWSESDVRLPQLVAYGATAETPEGLLCLGGENESGSTNKAYLIRVDSANQITIDDDAVPDLPLPCTAGGAAVIDQFVYLVAGKTRDWNGNQVASRLIWRLDISNLANTGLTADAPRWEAIVGWPHKGPERMFPLVTAQYDGFSQRLYVIGGRRYVDKATDDPRALQASRDAWSFNPQAYDASAFSALSGKYNGVSPWNEVAPPPVPLTAGTAVPVGPAHIIVPAAATLEIYQKVLEAGIPMKDFDHPGFPQQAFSYHTITDTWTHLGETPSNQVTTPAVRWGDDVFLISGEVRPRVRTKQAWKIGVVSKQKSFGWFNMTVVATYLLAMVSIGVYFTFKNKSTDDYFRGGKSIPWWAAGCSIFATMLSSITYMAVPAKAFAQDWVYAVGNLLILGVAPIAIYIALPFFRRIDATSAYEYLERRFNRAARLIGSGSFSLFHIFRMGVVLALAALALTSITPLTPQQCVMVMGFLSIIYCTLGGVEAVIWTDTIQTFILIGGALVCIVFALLGAEPDSLTAAVESGKFHTVNLDLGSASFMTMALWVVVLGGFGQNLASYTADQAVVQRYMTTPNERLAARAIWLNGFMALPAAIIFFGMGTVFWMFYRSNPEKLDPTMAADRIMPYFISQELPVGIAGIVVAGIFAAAQSTVSTSMNSGATTVVTDFVRPVFRRMTDHSLLWTARWVTLIMGILGTITGLYFVDPSIKSLFDQFIGILGMFLGVLAGLFALGATTRRANSFGSLVGASTAISFMTLIVFAANDRVLMGFDCRYLFDLAGTEIYRVSGYLYAFIGIAVCYVVGYLASLCFPGKSKDIAGMTLWDIGTGKESGNPDD